MTRKLSRRGFVKSSLLASAALPLAVQAQNQTPAQPASAPAPRPQDSLPTGRIGDQEFSRLMLGGNLIGGWAHARDLSYVSTLMRRYNTPSKIRETLEIAESSGITAMNSWVMDDNAQLFEHWKCGGKMKWISQVRLDEGGGFSQLQKAIDQGAVGVHLTADAAEGLLDRNKLDTIAESVQFIRRSKKLAGIASHDLRLLVECEKAKLDFDFYQKTFHSHEYYTAPKPGDKTPVGVNDNSWCNDPQAVVDFMAKATTPWIAFKILAAGAIPPRAAFPYAFNNGADFILVGMFDWQIPENAKLARRVVEIVKGSGSKRTRAWCS
ncbi:MAG TPA: hypothetical protein VN673_04705 [Clostridia bacterium]|nr:hypothetical protein [Clostridia bacterium]